MKKPIFAVIITVLLIVQYVLGILAARYLVWDDEIEAGLSLLEAHPRIEYVSPPEWSFLRDTLIGTRMPDSDSLTDSAWSSKYLYRATPVWID